MKLYMHPASTASRPILLFIADHGLEVEQRLVDIKRGEQQQPWFTAINPNQMVPVLEDGAFQLTEGSAILKYLADKIETPAYPKQLRERARVNEAMDWFNTNFSRTFVYGLCYPQLMPAYRLESATGQNEAIVAGKRGAERFLRVLNDQMLGPQKEWICGEQITLADYLGSGMISLGDVIGCTFSAYPNVARWYAQLKNRPNWQKANAALAAWKDAARGPLYETV